MSIKEFDYQKRFEPGDTILVYRRMNQPDPFLAWVLKVHANGVDAWSPQIGLLSGAWHLDDERIQTDADRERFAYERGLFVLTPQSETRITIQKKFVWYTFSIHRLFDFIAKLKKEIRWVEGEMNLAIEAEEEAMAMPTLADTEGMTEEGPSAEPAGEAAEEAGEETDDDGKKAKRKRG